MIIVGILILILKKIKDKGFDIVVLSKGTIENDSYELIQIFRSIMDRLSLKLPSQFISYILFCSELGILY